jgi:hypothetical protein
MTQNSKGQSNFQVVHRIRDIGVSEILIIGARATIKDRRSSITMNKNTSSVRGQLYLENGFLG